jgi:hypothetical protein
MLLQAAQLCFGSAQATLKRLILQTPQQTKTELCHDAFKKVKVVYEKFELWFSTLTHAGIGLASNDANVHIQSGRYHTVTEKH